MQMVYSWKAELKTDIFLFEKQEFHYIEFPLKFLSTRLEIRGIHFHFSFYYLQYNKETTEEIFFSHTLEIWKVLLLCMTIYHK